VERPLSKAPLRKWRRKTLLVIVGKPFIWWEYLMLQHFQIAGNPR